MLGIDPGSRVTGYGLVREASGCLQLLEAGTLRVGSIADLGVRLGRIHTGLTELIERFQPNEAAIENVFVSKNVMSALKLGQARGAAIAACAVAGLPVSEYEPTLVKQTLVGNGRAEKSQVAFMVAQVLGVRQPDWAVDASDALGIAVCHLNMRRMRRLAGV
ncbi:crossover junction endodeoxyribonuclease RuvC [Desulfobaculum xiamenense]|uniref:Crossover junction endodeoxyribonuclease RuvC n=1 Tax=Desulfobaculum xiamenense TaxID=995050 RepID=A0A846QUF0_9BACT|nr:crossover junction endodeoxyribonuclease RuvC [Desulfobaculum xiamenense]